MVANEDKALGEEQGAKACGESQLARLVHDAVVEAPIANSLNYIIRYFTVKLNEKKRRRGSRKTGNVRNVGEIGERKGNERKSSLLADKSERNTRYYKNYY